MKIDIVGLFALMVFLAACGSAPVSAPSLEGNATQANAAVTLVISTPFPASTPSVPTSPPTLPTPTFISAALPGSLIVAYVVEDRLWIWKKNTPQPLVQRKSISDPLISDDGQWLLFLERHGSPDGSEPPSNEVWVVKTDGSKLQRLLGAEDLMTFVGEEPSLLINDISWIPGSHEILFNTEKIVEGPPGSLPLFDLYSLDLAGSVKRLADPGKGGKFIPSPNGQHVALITDSRIKILDLENGEQRTLLEFKPLSFPNDSGPSTPKVIWDPQGRFVITSILPQDLYSPETYAGELEQIWRLFVDGQVELIAEFQPFVPAAGIAFSPNLQYFFYLKNLCIDGMGMLYVHNIASAEEYPISCVWNLPEWVPDSEHFIFELDGLQQLSSILDNTNRPLDVLNMPTDPNIHALRPLTWINDEYFLLVLRSREICTLNVATLQGVATEIAHMSSDACPQMVDSSLPK